MSFRNYSNFSKNNVENNVQKHNDIKMNENIEDTENQKQLDEKNLENDIKNISNDTSNNIIGNKGKVINCNRLYLRIGPSKNDDHITLLERNQEVKILDDSDKDFYKVEVNEIEGYCMKKYIQIR